MNGDERKNVVAQGSGGGMKRKRTSKQSRGDEKRGKERKGEARPIPAVDAGSRVGE